MRVKMIANELTEAEIDFVSLVKHGANRSPFKIIKAEDIPEDAGLMDRLRSLFGDEPAPEVMAFFVKNDEVERYEPLLEKAGFAITCKQPLKDVTVYKQDNFNEDADVSLVVRFGGGMSSSAEERIGLLCF